MENSVVINGKHLLADWGLHIENNDLVSPPEVNDVYKEVLGGATIDLTEVNGPVTYKRRKISLEIGGINRKAAWRTFFSKFINEYHGREVSVIFDDDKGFYYKGRAYISKDVEKAARIGKFDMEIDAEPYKYEAVSSQEPWKWDIFNFASGAIRYQGELEITGERSVSFPSGNMLTVPVFIVSQSGNLKLFYDGKEYNLQDGRNRYPQIKINGVSEEKLIFKGTGKVKIDYRGGGL